MKPMAQIRNIASNKAALVALAKEQGGSPDDSQGGLRVAFGDIDSASQFKSAALAGGWALGASLDGTAVLISISGRRVRA